ncbi:lytic transglycosylase domain-containing protein [Salmonella enterica subsp. salamae]|nr:lytic transglycosylase domain-containing protein [Salmonella enterica subsp. salamae]ECG0942354.1 lytic transglycosylase domain-containing protein [Salmonella enterica subsp. salamae]ECJ4597072.1 lytic transglycosylase domain-containing protein [Salmonella enterica subsp. salamae]HDC1420731.1 lytic transglycosylase domain-containing protein [Salmonella enterica]
MRYQYVCLICAMSFLPAGAAEPPRASLQWRNEVIRTAREIWGLNAPVADFAGQLHQESGWVPDALSSAGAQGMAQFMPTTATWVSQRYPALHENKPFNPVWAIRALVQYDHQLWKSVSAKNSCQRMAFTLSAYNGGQGWVNRDKKLATEKGLDAAIWFEHVERVNAGRSAANWRENRHYPKAILYQHAPRYLQWGQASCIH